VTATDTTTDREWPTLSLGQPAPPTPKERPTDIPLTGHASDLVHQIGFAGYVVRVALLAITVLSLSLAFFIVVISGLEHQVSQTREYDRFRAALAAGTAPTGQTDQSGKHLFALGTPVALLEVPSLHMREVVGEGTTPQVLTAGPGHRRDTPLPGQAGTSVIMGRQASYGGPFKHIHQLRLGAKITVTVGFGTNVDTFKVIDIRQAGDPRPPLLASGASRLTLVTAAGTPFMPGGLLYVDADLVSAVQPASTQVISSPSELLRSESANANDTSSVWALVLWLQALILVVVGAIWAWHRWGRHQTWIVFLPLTALVGYYVADQVTRLLPNLL
jgi:LPXTG-site transpeptidase (sortase) family protein